jgi:hypothetical protein
VTEAGSRFLKKGRFQLGSGESMKLLWFSTRNFISASVLCAADGLKGSRRREGQSRLHGVWRSCATNNFDHMIRPSN